MTTRLESDSTLFQAVCQHFGTPDVLRAKGGGFFVRGVGHVSTAKARRLTGIKASPRNVRPKVANCSPDFYAFLKWSRQAPKK